MSRDDEFTPDFPSASRQADPIDLAPQPADQEHESAHALLQLSHGGLGNAEATSQDVASIAERHPNSLLTSQQILEDAAAKRSHARRTKGRKRKQAKAAGKAEAAQAIAALTNENVPDADSNDAPRRKGSADRGQDLHEPSLLASAHPLDDLSTDDEVQNLEAEVQNLVEPVALPSYTALQRQQAARNSSSEQRPRPRKRRKPSTTSKGPAGKSTIPQGAPQSNDSTAVGDGGISLNDDLPPQSQLYTPYNGHLEISASRVPEMVIDPSLTANTIDHNLPRRRSSRRPVDARNSTPTTIETGNRRTRRRMHEDQTNEQEKDYVSPYTFNFQLAETQPLVNREASQEKLGSHESASRGPRSGLEADPIAGQHHFGVRELKEIEGFRTSWCQKNGRQPQDFNALIQSNLRTNRGAAELFGELQQIFPHHRSIYIQRFCRRKFHNFSARGTWTEAEDQSLRLAVAEKGTSWKRVGEMIQRFPEDCRDRWRNYLSTSEKQNHDMWTEGETQNLASCILDRFYERAIHQWEQETDISGYFPPADPDIGPEDLDMKLINWQAVSDRMRKSQFLRTRLQCSYKWSKIKVEDQGRLLEIAQHRRQNNSGSVIDQAENHTKGGSSWRAQQASKSVQRMLVGDKMDLLEALLDCDARTEEAILWKALGSAWFQRRWTTAERKAAWLALKGPLQSSESGDYRFAARLLLDGFSRSERDQRWDPEKEPPSSRRAYRRREPGTNSGDSNNHGQNHVPNGRASGHQTQQQDVPREVIEINSDNDSDEHRPPNDGIYSGDLIGAAYPPHLGRQLRSQPASMSESAPFFQPNSEENVTNVSLELQTAAESPRADSEISPQLTRRLLALQNA